MDENREVFSDDESSRQDTGRSKSHRSRKFSPLKKQGRNRKDIKTMTTNELNQSLGQLDSNKDFLKLNKDKQIYKSADRLSAQFSDKV